MSTLLSSITKTNISTVTSSKLHFYSHGYSDDEIRLMKIASLTFSFATSVLLSYVMFALFYHDYNKKRLVGCGGKHQGSSLVNSLILLTACVIFVRLVIQFPLIKPPSPTYCAVFGRVCIITYAFSLLLIYFVLWYRVYTSFYSNPLLKRNIRTWQQWLNKLTLIFMVGAGVADFSIFISRPPEIATEFGCYSSDSEHNTKIKYAILISLGALFQISLLFSFIYPLYMHRRMMLDRGIDSTSTLTVVRRAAVVAGVDVVSDMIACGIDIKKYPATYISHVVSSANLLINLMCVVFSLVNWREKLMPFNRPLSPASTMRTYEVERKSLPESTLK